MAISHGKRKGDLNNSTRAFKLMIRSAGSSIDGESSEGSTGGALRYHGKTRGDVLGFTSFNPILSKRLPTAVINVR